MCGVCVNISFKNSCVHFWVLPTNQFKIGDLQSINICLQPCILADGDVSFGDPEI